MSVKANGRAAILTMPQPPTFDTETQQQAQRRRRQALREADRPKKKLLGGARRAHRKLLKEAVAERLVIIELEATLEQLRRAIECFEKHLPKDELSYAQVMAVIEPEDPDGLALLPAIWSDTGRLCLEVFNVQDLLSGLLHDHQTALEHHQELAERYHNLVSDLERELK